MLKHLNSHNTSVGKTTLAHRWHKQTTSGGWLFKRLVQFSALHHACDYNSSCHQCHYIYMLHVQVTMLIFTWLKLNSLFLVNKKLLWCLLWTFLAFLKWKKCVKKCSKRSQGLIFCLTWAGLPNLWMRYIRVIFGKFLVKSAINIERWTNTLPSY